MFAALSHKLRRPAWAVFPVQPETLLRWHRELIWRKWALFARRRRPGRPAVSPECRELAGRVTGVAFAAPSAPAPADECRLLRSSMPPHASRHSFPRDLPRRHPFCSNRLVVAAGGSSKMSAGASARWCDWTRGANATGSAQIRFIQRTASESWQRIRALLWGRSDAETRVIRSGGSRVRLLGAITPLGSGLNLRKTPA